MVLTGQHREMVTQVMDLFSLKADQDLNLMAPGRPSRMSPVLHCRGCGMTFRPIPSHGAGSGRYDHGLCGSPRCLYEQIPVGHVEAGLRTDNILDPFPEEANSRLISQVAQLHFAPTQQSERNLLASGVVGKVMVTGNTVIDALLQMAERAPQLDDVAIDWQRQRVILATVHRRENWGERLQEIAEGMLQGAGDHPEAALLLPLHRNPTVREPLQELLGDHPRVLTEPLDYDRLVAAMKGCTLLLTDSGGLQEEAPALGKPVLVLRRTTERPEAVEAGTARLVGTDAATIAEEAHRLLSDQTAYDAMARAVNPFGDGQASQRILDPPVPCLRSDAAFSPAGATAGCWGGLGQHATLVRILRAMA